MAMPMYFAACETRVADPTQQAMGPLRFQDWFATQVGKCINQAWKKQEFVLIGDMINQLAQTIEAPEQFGVNDPDILTAIRLHKITRVRQHCSAEEWDLFELRSRGQAFKLR